MAGDEITTENVGEEVRFIELAAGTYTVTVVDGNNCIQSCEVTVPETNQVNCTSFTVSIASQVPTCSGNADGYVLAVPTGGVEPYSFDWGGGITSDSLINIGAGSYTVTVVDRDGCRATVSTTITAPAPITLAPSTSPGTCGRALGSIQLNPNGGTPDYSINWDDTSENTLTRDSLETGIYYVTVSDANGCSVSDTIEISNQDVAINASLRATNIGCGNPLGNIDLTHDSTATTTYEWGNNATSQDLSDLTAGTYSVTITQGGCTLVLTDSILVLPTFAAALETSPITCEEPAMLTAIPADANGMYTYSWSTGDTTQSITTNLVGETILVTITDATGCSLVLSDSVTAEIPFSGEVQLFTPISCYGETGVVNVATIGTVVGPITYEWSILGVGNTQTLFAAPGGEHTVTITDGSGCSLAVPVVVPEPAPLVVDTALVTAAGCDGPGSIALTVRGGTGDYGYSWSGNGTGEGPVRDNITEAGTYFVTITDANACSVIDTFVVGAATAFTLETSVSMGDCNPDNPTTINLTITGGGGNPEIAWNTGATTAMIVAPAAGTYTAVVTETGGCTDSISVTVAIPVSFNVSPNARVENVSCNAAGAIYLNIDSEYTYRWDTDSGDTTDYLENLEAGDYAVTVTNTSGCDTSFVFSVIDEGGNFIASINAESLNLDCPDSREGQVIATNSGGVAPITFGWEDGSTDQFRSGLGAGTYWVDVTDGNGCVRSDSITLTAPDPPQIDAVLVTAAGCGADAGTIKVVGAVGQRYSIDGGENWVDSLFTGLPAGSYSLQFGSINYDCVYAYGTLTVGEGNGDVELIAEMAVLPGGDCPESDGGSILLTPTYENLEFALNDGPFTTEASFAGLIAGTYAVHVRDPESSCPTQTDSVTVGLLPTLMLDTASVASPLCYGDADGEIAITATGGSGNYSFNWSDALTEDTRLDLPAGTFGVTVTDGTGCTDSLMIDLPEDAAMAAVDARVNDITVCSVNEVSINLEGIDDNHTYTWTLPNGESISGPEFSTADRGDYRLLVEDGNGCTFTDTFTVDFLNNEEFFADLLMPTRGRIDTAITIINRTLPSPDSVVWNYDESLVTFLGGNGFLNNFSFAEPGIYEIGMDAYSGGCSATVTRQIEIFETLDSLDLNAGLSFGRDLRDLEAWPIPHNGTFRVRGTAVRDLTATFYFFDENGILLYQDQRELNAGVIDEPFGQDGEALDIVDFLPLGTQTLVITTDVSVVTIRHVRGL